jgi:hypothetical protein
MRIIFARTSFTIAGSGDPSNLKALMRAGLISLSERSMASPSGSSKGQFSKVETTVSQLRVFGGELGKRFDGAGDHDLELVVEPLDRFAGERAVRRRQPDSEEVFAGLFSDIDLSFIVKFISLAQLASTVMSWLTFWKSND